MDESRRDKSAGAGAIGRRDGILRDNSRGHVSECSSSRRSNAGMDREKLNGRLRQILDDVRERIVSETPGSVQNLASME